MFHLFQPKQQSFPLLVKSFNLLSKINLPIKKTIENEIIKLETSFRLINKTRKRDLLEEILAVFFFDVGIN
jgi:hypothetical protein